MLVAAGSLPPRDENATRLHRYTVDVVAEVTDPELRGVLTRYARWHVVGRAKTNRHGRISAATADRCRRDIQTAKAFLDHLAAHGHNLDTCPQSCVDAWITFDHSRRMGFLRWLTHGGYLPRCRLPAHVPQKSPGHDTDTEAQLDLARRLLHDPDSASVEDRVAACLILLYAQPVAKIVTLTSDDIFTRGQDTYLRLGSEPLLLVPPLKTLVTTLPVVKPFGTASVLANQQWLFTGKNSGAHLQPPSLMARMNRLGIRTRASRNTAMVHLASTTPPAVFAQLIGVSIGTATRWAELSGAAWNSYAAARS